MGYGFFVKQVSDIQIVRTDKCCVSGALIDEPGKEVFIFRGIPYAAPPVGDLRWKLPVARCALGRHPGMYGI
jgi:carboxylesterase type B